MYNVHSQEPLKILVVLDIILVCTFMLPPPILWAVFCWYFFFNICPLKVRPCLYRTILTTKFPSLIQVNLCQKLLFLNQLTHNVTKDCSLNSLKNTSSEHFVYKYCFECQNKNKKKQFLYTTCSVFVFFGEFNKQSIVILWINWCKNVGFWKRFMYL